VKKSEMVIRSISVSLGVALLAAMSAANADSRLWREQVTVDASKTIALSVSAGETASSTAPAYLWREQLDAAESHARSSRRFRAGQPEERFTRPAAA